MAEPVTIARPYAEASFRLARDSDMLPAWSDMLTMLDAVMGDERVRAAIDDPNVTPQALESFILGIAGDRLDGSARNLVQVLIQNGRLELVPYIRTLYEELRREHEGVLEVRILTALPMSDGQVRDLVTRLEAKHQRKVTAKVDVDPNLIGGVRLLIGDKVIDATVRGKLDAMAAALTH
ncbi:MAG: F0F1 ATP synthase subunit delta [Rhodospirillaceae bacterium]